jgi:uncharacterized protein with FMN-binding domain
LPESAPVTLPAVEPSSATTIAATATASSPESPPTPASTPTPTPTPTPAAAAPAKPAVVALAPATVEQAPEPGPVAEVAGETIETPQLPAWRDGYYTGWGQSRHGDIEAHLTIKEGRIVDAGILSCETRYPCSVIDSILYQPVDLQSPDVDKVSRATVSANAYYWGLVEALRKAEIAPSIPVPSQ